MLGGAVLRRVEKVGRKVFRIYQMYAVFRLEVVHLTILLVFFLTNRGPTFSGVGTPFASRFVEKSLVSDRFCHAAACHRNEHVAVLLLEGLTELAGFWEPQPSSFSLRV